ncbi:Putative porin [Fodinibius roseus]|uniref:Putative porin n=1 Tax=Fodinibius roseus TaxID=1194090 RepID=A0A1M5C6L2_9BACT|nr:putative porin [Fodinibius roseus]SHF50365.1 Putative porin [Fodinibius roseus]
MKLSFLTYVFILLWVVSPGAWAQVDHTSIDSVTVDTTILKPVTFTEASGAADTLSQEDQKPLIKVVPWEFHAPLGAEVTATDSTLRWKIWPDWTYKLNRKPGVVSYRMGTSIRSNAVQRYAHEPRHQELYWEGIPLNDPVSGMLNWSLIPQHKISDFYGEERGTHYRSTYYLRQYYLNEPLSRLIYSESKFSSRNLEFEVSHNLSQKTNIELRYWDRREGGEYNNSEVIGRQIFAKASHHLDNRHYLKLNYVNNKMDIGRPFGYSLSDMLRFNFDRYDTQANESNGNSTEINNLLALNFYRRSPDSTRQRKSESDNLHASLYRRSTQRAVQYSADSTTYNIGSVGLSARKWWTKGIAELEGGINYEYFLNKEQANHVLATGNWGLLEVEGKAKVHLASFLSVRGGGTVRSRSDGFRSYRLNAAADFRAGKLSLSPGLSVGSLMPTPQQLYWRSENFAGDPNLLNEEMQEARARLTYDITSNSRVGIRLQHKDINNGLMVEEIDILTNLNGYNSNMILGANRSYANKDSYASQSAAFFFDWDATHFELDGSATFHRFTNSTVEPNNPIPMSAEERIWLKGGAYWKGYMFGRATYVKAGLSGMIAPFRYQADHYNPELDYWQPVSSDQALPAFNRLDLDISARVRSIVFVMRWQNILDDVSQLGYFETAGYPMSQRKFLFGVRALFRN